jgi:hypothetical protein
MEWEDSKSMLLEYDNENRKRVGEYSNQSNMLDV